MADKKTIGKWIMNVVWVLIGAGTIVLLVAAIRKKDGKACKSVNIQIKDLRDNFFVDEKDVLAVITAVAGGKPAGKPTGSLNLRAMEAALEKNVWISDAQLYVDNNDVLQVSVTEREPVARVFNAAGESFYLDSSAARLPLSEKFSARLPVFTSFPGSTLVLSKADSTLLKDIKNLAMLIAADQFCMAMIEQTDITPQRSFEMIPKLGRSVILFGDGTAAAAKLEKLKRFYKQVVAKAGWNYYGTINLQYEGQVVAVRRGTAEVVADSLATRRLLDTIAARMERLADDSLQRFVPDNATNSTDSNFIFQSLQREDAEGQGVNLGSQEEALEPARVQPAAPVIVPPAVTPPRTNAPVQRPAVNAQPPPANVRRTVSPPARPPAVRQPNPPKPKPKPTVPPKPRAVMSPRNDY